MAMSHLKTTKRSLTQADLKFAQPLEQVRFLPLQLQDREDGHDAGENNQAAG